MLTQIRSILPLRTNEMIYVSPNADEESPGTVPLTVPPPNEDGGSSSLVAKLPANGGVSLSYRVSLTVEVKAVSETGKAAGGTEKKLIVDDACGTVAPGQVSVMKYKINGFGCFFLLMFIFIFIFIFYTLTLTLVAPDIGCRGFVFFILFVEQMLAIMGPSGAGKTSLLNCLSLRNKSYRQASLSSSGTFGSSTSSSTLYVISHS